MWSCPPIWDRSAGFAARRSLWACANPDQPPRRPALGRKDGPPRYSAPDVSPADPCNKMILLNNLLYDVSEMPIALDQVDREITEKPEHWDMRFIRNFMLLLGPVSSVFDFLTFGLLLLVFRADEALFQTGWFIESLATQVLVIFVLRTRRNPLSSRPHPLLATTSVAVVVLAVVLPFTPLGAWFGFVPPSAAFLFAIAGLTVSYLLLAQGAKWAFYRLCSPTGAVPAPLIRAPLPLIGRS